MRLPHETEILHLIDEASRLVGMLWPLDRAIAANPLHDDLERSFAESVSDLERQLGHRLWPTTAHGDEAKRRGLSELFEDLAVATLLRELTLAHRDTSTSPFELLHRHGGVRSSWGAMPRSVKKALERVLRDQGMEALLLISPSWSDEERVEEYRRHFARLPGWAAWAKWNDQWSRTPHKAALARAEFLAISLAVDLAWMKAGNYDVVAPLLDRPSGVSTTGLLRLQALEVAVHGELLNRLGSEAEPTMSEPRFQVVTCIDVRSEPLRRALEVNPEIHTFGFAGFFGVLAEVERSGEDEAYESAPVLVQPTLRITGGKAVDLRARSLMTASATVAELTHEPHAMFALAEVAGFVALPWLLARSARGSRCSGNGCLVDARG